MQKISGKLDSLIKQSVTCSSAPEATPRSVPTCSSSSVHSTPVSSSDPRIPGNPLPVSSPSSSPSSHSEHENPVVAELSTGFDSDENESDFDFSDVDVENLSEDHLN